MRSTAQLSIRNWSNSLMLYTLYNYLVQYCTSTKGEPHEFKYKRGNGRPVLRGFGYNKKIHPDSDGRASRKRKHFGALDAFCHLDRCASFQQSNVRQPLQWRGRVRRCSQHGEIVCRASGQGFRGTRGSNTLITLSPLGRTPVRPFFIPRIN